ncbi:MAG TPA: ATP-binding cassette domain-containing protein [Candidatus Limnocylindrales bacterium]|nr:ATP-binding cassette domain-containing protein [Candidatus Limnocylindrales bacterium]
MTATATGPSGGPTIPRADAVFTGGPAMPRQGAVEVEHLTHVYPSGKVLALEDVSVSIGHGEIVGVVGQNGSGKTTFSKHLNGLLKPTSGRVVVNGIDTAGKRVQELAAHVGYVFQNPNHQLFATTVQADLAFGPQNLGLPEDEVQARVERAIEFFGLQHVRELHPYRISFPMRKLVGIAGIYTMQPAIFVLDEPTTGQDHVTTQVINTLIRRLRDEGATVVCVSHDMPLLADVVDRLLVMWNAHLIADASPREVFSNTEVMARTKLEPPQVTSISMQLGRRPALSVDDLATDLESNLTSVGVA